MARLALNKGQMKRERDRLALFEKVLPSLELKRMQLTAEFKRAVVRQRQALDDVSRLKDAVSRQIPMLAFRPIALAGLVTVKAVAIDDDNIVGVTVPKLGSVDFAVADYSMLAKPHWVDVYVARAKEMIQARLAARVAVERVARLDLAVRRITQRVNLFEKILIPTARKNIQRIGIFLGDAERSAIVRSKIAKAMHQKERRELLAGEES